MSDDYIKALIAQRHSKKRQQETSAFIPADDATHQHSPFSSTPLSQRSDHSFGHTSNLDYAPTTENDDTQASADPLKKISDDSRPQQTASKPEPIFNLPLDLSKISKTVIHSDIPNTVFELNVPGKSKTFETPIKELNNVFELKTSGQFIETPPKTAINVKSIHQINQAEIAQAQKPSNQAEIAQAQKPSDQAEIAQAQKPSDQAEIAQAQKPSDQAETAQAQKPSDQAKIAQERIEWDQSIIPVAQSACDLA